MEAGRLGRHGDSAVQPAVRASSCASVLATTRHPDTAAVCVWGRAEMRGERNWMCQWSRCSDHIFSQSNSKLRLIISQA